MPRICRGVRRGAWRVHAHTLANLGVGGCFLPLHGLGGGDPIKLRLQRLNARHVRLHRLCNAAARRCPAHLQAALKLVCLLGGCSRSFKNL